MYVFILRHELVYFGYFIKSLGIIWFMYFLFYENVIFMYYDLFISPLKLVLIVERDFKNSYLKNIYEILDLS